MAERVILIDGTAMIFRAYFAIPANLATRTGLHTNAIFGMTNMFRKLLAGKTPELAAVIFDPPGGANARKEQFKDYKANREGAPDELSEQIPYIDKVVEAYRFKRLQIPGFEADDVIATLTRRAVAQGYEVHIISADKDFSQLIGPGIRMIDAIRDITYDAELVRKKWGVRPEQFVDMQAMLGDKLDNIPGVPGIGPKGAGQLLEKYGTLDGIYEHLHEIPGKNGKLLEQYRDQAYMSRNLAQLQDVPLELELTELRYQAPDLDSLNELYRELEFFSLLSEGARSEQSRAEEGNTSYRLDTDPTMPDSAAITPVAEGFFRWVGLAFSATPGEAFYTPGITESVKAFLEDASKPKYVHEQRILQNMCARQGINLQGVVGDTRLASFLVEPTKVIPHELPQVVKEYLHRTVRPLKSLTGSGQKEVPLSQCDPQEVADYACHLADVVGQLWPILQEKLRTEGQEEQYRERDLPLLKVLAQMELDGILVDPVDLEAMGREFRERLVLIEQKIFELAGHEFNIGSTKQLGTVLFDELKLPVIKKTKTGYSTDAEVLERLAPKHEICQELLEHRRLAKLINTYTDVLGKAVNPETGRIHATFQPTTGATGRIISTDPDLQRTPIRTPEGERIRRTFIAPPGKRLISADWSQIELRVLAHFTKDPNLVEAFRTNTDIHKRTASELFSCTPHEVTKPQREIAKTINFATIYGQGATALSQILGIPRKDAQQYIETYFQVFAGVREWLDRTIAEAHQNGYVTTLFGRRRYIPELSSKNFVDRQTGERIAANTPIQGTAADLCKLAMLKIADEIQQKDLQTRLLLQIHDELVLECPLDEVEAASELTRRHMETVVPLEVPLVVNLGVGANWGEAHG